MGALELQCYSLVQDDSGALWELRNQVQSIMGTRKSSAKHYGNSKFKHRALCKLKSSARYYGNRIQMQGTMGIQKSSSQLSDWRERGNKKRHPEKRLFRSNLKRSVAISQADGVGRALSEVRIKKNIGISEQQQVKDRRAENQNELQGQMLESQRPGRFAMCSTNI